MHLMGINLTKTLTPLSTMLDGISMAQKATSNNIANVSTPGYAAQHPSFSSYIEQAANPFETSMSVRMGPSQLSRLVDPAEGKVNLQQEMIDMQKNMLHYNLVVKRLSTTINNLKTASQIGR